MKNTQYINCYRLQYWLYAILNKNFGKMVSFKRDSLHSRYDVNRHSFNVTGVPYNVIVNHLSIVLTEAGYTEKKSGDNVTLSRVLKKGNILEKHYISLSLNKSIVEKKYYLTIYPSVYFQKAE